MRTLPIIFATLIFAGFQLSWTPSSDGQDTVFTRAAKGGSVPRKGVIVEWKGDTLTLDMDGREKSIRNEEIVKINTSWTDEYRQAESLFDSSQFPQAAVAYQAALEIETREWARNVIRSRLVQCSSVLENHSAAGVYFSQIIASDPQTRFLHLIPLPWLRAMTDRGANAQVWIKSDVSALKLLGASWLQGTEMRAQAQEVLADLCNDLKPEIAHLAKLQLWRAKVVSAKERDLLRLESQISRMPKSIKAPALLILSEIQRRLQRKDDSLLTLMRIPILHSENMKLSAAALQKSAVMMIDAGQGKDAARLLREIQRDFAGTRFANEAAAQLQSLPINNQ